MIVVNYRKTYPMFSLPVESILSVAKYVVPSSLILLGLWEHGAKIRKSEKRPSVLIDKATDVCKEKFTLLGTKIAEIAGLVYYLRLPELFKSYSELLVSSCKFVLSPVYTLYGYIKYYKTAVSKRSAIVIGTIVIIGTSVFVFMKMNDIDYMSFIPFIEWTKMLKTSDV